MKWYTCCNEEGLRHGGEWLVAAVQSCLRNTSLSPHLVYSGRDNAFLDYLASIGVKIVRHRLSFADDIDKAPLRPGFDKVWANGTFLRFDIPLIEQDDEVVLYTDTDVIFLDDIECPALTVPLAAANEYIIADLPPQETNEAFNAGVLFLNIPVLRRLHTMMIRFTVADDFENGSLGWYDQSVLNVLFREFRAPLAQEFNWRPFAGVSSSPRIVHFHLVKPTHVPALERNEQPPGLPAPYRHLYEGARQAYAKYLQDYYSHLVPEGLAALSSAFPDSAHTKA